MVNLWWWGAFVAQLNHVMVAYDAYYWLTYGWYQQFHMVNKWLIVPINK